MIVVDIETTGLNPRKNSIVSIGAVDFHNPEDQFYEERKIFEGAEVHPQALKVNGFTEEQIRDEAKRSLEEIIEAFLSWTEKSGIKVLAGHNIAGFDVLFLINSANKYGLNWNMGRRCVDTHSLCYAHHLKRKAPPLNEGESSLNLDNVLIYVGLPPEPKPHNALIGAKLEAEVLSRIIHGKALFSEYSNHEIPEYLKNDT